MDWWEDLWLNESFADFAALHCLRKISKQFSFKLSDFGVMSNMRKIWGYVNTLNHLKLTIILERRWQDFYTSYCSRSS